MLGASGPLAPALFCLLRPDLSMSHSPGFEEYKQPRYPRSLRKVMPFSTPHTPPNPPPPPPPPPAGHPVEQINLHWESAVSWFPTQGGLAQRSLDDRQRLLPVMYRRHRCGICVSQCRLAVHVDPARGRSPRPVCHRFEDTCTRGWPWAVESRRSVSACRDRSAQPRGRPALRPVLPCADQQPPRSDRLAVTVIAAAFDHPTARSRMCSVPSLLPAKPVTGVKVTCPEVARLTSRRQRQVFFWPAVAGSR